MTTNTFKTESIQTGIAPARLRPATAPLYVPQERNVTQKGKVEIWFIDPLMRLKGDDGFVCLLICCPLLEAIIRFELDVPDEQDVAFSDNAPALKWFAAFMKIPEKEARLVWDCLRNGMVHRGMIKNDLPYILTGERPGRPAEFKSGVVYIYVWELRDRVVDLLRKHHKRLWDSTCSPLPRITVQS